MAVVIFKVHHHVVIETHFLSLIISEIYLDKTTKIICFLSFLPSFFHNIVDGSNES